MVLLGGADLFTGNAMIAPVALWRGHIDGRALARSWALSYVGEADHLHYGFAILDRLLVQYQQGDPPMLVRPHTCHHYRSPVLD